MSTSTVIPKHVEEVFEHASQRLSQKRGPACRELRYGRRRFGYGGRCAEQRRDSTAAGPYPDPDFHQLDSWIVIHENNTATFYVGKTDLGQGTGTGFRQLMSDELDIAFDQTTCIMGSTDITVNQGGSGGSIGHGERFLADAACCR